MSDPRPSSDVDWLLYDGECGFCRSWVRSWEGVLERRGIRIAPLQAEWVAEAAPLEKGALTDDLRLLLADGRLVSGADAYRVAMRRIWWAWPLWLLSVLPGLSWLFDRAYRAFADNRHRISRSCRLE